MKQAILDFINSGILLSKPTDAFYSQEFEAFVQSCHDRLLTFHNYKSAADTLKNSYIPLMKVVQNPKIENINILIFSATYIASKILYHKRQNEEETKDSERWHLDNYHVIIFTLNGFMVSDAFIETNFKKYFSDKLLDYTKKIVHVPPYTKPTNFFGHSIEFPKLESKEGAEFAQALSGIFKSPSKAKRLPIVLEDSQIDVPQHHYKSPQIRNMKINVNSLSPSLASALHKTSLGFEKPKIIKHPLSKPNLGDVNFLQRFRDIHSEAQKPIETKIQKSHRSNIVEQHNLTYPPKEYFQKNAKVDGFFKNFLELKYVLDQRKETMTNIKTYKQRAQYVPSYTPYLQMETQNQSQTQIKQFIPRSSVDLPSPSPDLEKDQPNKFDVQAATTKATFNPQNTFFKSESNKSPTTFNVTSNSFFQYMNKQKEYKQKFDRFVSNESTSPEHNINQIKSELLKKQHFFKKSLGKLRQ